MVPGERGGRVDAAVASQEVRGRRVPPAGQGKGVGVYVTEAEQVEVRLPRVGFDVTTNSIGEPGPAGQVRAADRVQGRCVERERSLPTAGRSLHTERTDMAASEVSRNGNASSHTTKTESSFPRNAAINRRLNLELRKLAQNFMDRISQSPKYFSF
jgi:hypothetical protein